MLYEYIFLCRPHITVLSFTNQSYRTETQIQMIIYIHTANNTVRHAKGKQKNNIYKQQAESADRGRVIPSASPVEIDKQVCFGCRCSRWRSGPCSRGSSREMRDFKYQYVYVRLHNHRENRSECAVSFVYDQNHEHCVAGRVLVAHAHIQVGQGARRQILAHTQSRLYSPRSDSLQNTVRISREVLIRSSGAAATASVSSSRRQRARLWSALRSRLLNSPRTDSRFRCR